MLPTPKSFVSRRGAFGGYEVTGWKYAGDSAWHVKMEPTSHYQRPKAYVVRDGAFEPETASANDRVGILTLIGQWEAGLPGMETDLLI